jgi:hypothetical protein
LRQVESGEPQGGLGTERLGSQTEGDSEGEMRQIAGSFAEYEKARLVAKLKAARERKRAAAPNQKCEGRKSWAEINPKLVREAKRLRRRSPKGHQRSLRAIAVELSKLGFVNDRGGVFSASSVRSILV